MTWNEAFRRYIDKRFGDDAQKKAALSLKLPPSTISYWVNGTLPREPMRKRVERWSEGDVPAELHVARSRKTGTDG